MTKDLFDFNDLSDLPEELAGRLTSDTDKQERDWAGIVLAGVERGFSELSINQIIAVATRMGFELPTVTTIRNYLNKGVARGLIGKPTRQSYGAPGTGSAVEEAFEDGAKEAPEAPVAEVDPLADLI